MPSHNVLREDLEGSLETWGKTMESAQLFWAMFGPPLMHYCPSGLGTESTPAVGIGIPVHLHTKLKTLLVHTPEN